VIDIDKRIRPQPLLQFLPRHHLARALQQDGENLKGLAAEFQFDAGFTKFARHKVNFEDPEADQSGGLAVRRHCREPQLPQF
jgi:hypothetical protein